MNPNNELNNAAADLCDRLADGLDALSTPLRRLALAFRPEEKETITKRGAKQPLIQPNVEPTELDRVRAARALSRSGIPVRKNGGNK